MVRYTPVFTKRDQPLRDQCQIQQEPKDDLRRKRGILEVVCY